MKERLRRQTLNENKSKTACLRGYLGMGWSEKIDSVAFGEAGLTDLTSKYAFSDNLEPNEDRKTELVGVDFT
ncbi:MAG: hypothetical protein QMC83_00005 [Thermodesulfovibrionales bacterium]|nr:hypothetical protein [Thermodesulfovibrionales bacterium]